jgi:RNA polymerase sigma-70 factor (ECF subfamily)
MDEHRASDGRLTPLRERQLIQRAQRGCKESARALIESHQDRLHAFVWKMVRDRHESEEVCQDAFLRAFAALDSFDPAYRFSTWLFTIGYRLSLNAIRRKRDYTGDIDFATFSRKGETREGVSDEIANSEEAHRLKDAIWNSVDQLTPAQRGAVLLFYRESMSCQEIGQVLGMPAATIKSHLHRARHSLKELLVEKLGDDWSSVRFDEAAGMA